MEFESSSISMDLQGESMLCIITETNLENVLLVLELGGCLHESIGYVLVFVYNESFKLPLCI